MKKALAQRTASPPLHRTFTPRTRLVSVLLLLGLMTGLGVFAARPAHTASGPIAVSVNNFPLATTAADSPDKQAIQFETGQITVDAGNEGSTTHSVYTVPAGKRLVIETISATSFIFKDPDHYTLSCTTYGGVGSVGAVTSFSILPDGSPASEGAAHPHQYADAGSQVYVDLFRSEANGQAGVYVIFTGYLVDTP